MKVHWKQINPGYNPYLFQAYLSIIKHPHFAYSPKTIVKEFTINKFGRFKLRVIWQNEDQCTCDMYKRYEVDDSIPSESCFKMAVELFKNKA